MKTLQSVMMTIISCVIRVEQTRESPTQKNIIRYKTRKKRSRSTVAEEMERQVRFAIFLLSLAVAVSALSEDETKASEEWTKRSEDMKFCLKQENVTEEEMKDFIFNGKNEDANDSIKMAVYCFVKKINFFDGVTWNTDVINEAEKKNPEMLKLIKDCLTKDDFTLPAHDRAYQIQKCVLEKGSL